MGLFDSKHPNHKAVQKKVLLVILLLFLLILLSACKEQVRYHEAGSVNVPLVTTKSLKEV